MTPRKRLSLATRRASSSASQYREAQDELHEAFEEAYGFPLAIEDLLGDAGVDGLVYGNSVVPSLADFDAAVAAKTAEEI
jgi:hypothetical protein